MLSFGSREARGAGRRAECTAQVVPTSWSTPDCTGSLLARRIWLRVALTSDVPDSRIRPLFLLSLPRSGSTLVQRVLAAHPQVSTTAEPWILLPLVYARRWNGIRAEYGHQFAAAAIDDFATALNGGAAAFDMRLRNFVDELYRDASDEGATYFLDKTPRYHHIVEDLFRLFPDAKFLFLWRNPLSVVASLLETMRKNQFEPYDFPGELVRGPAALASAFDAHRDQSHAVRFEDLIGEDSVQHWREVFDYLELEWDHTVLERFSHVQLRGNFMDPTGSRRYIGLSTEPLDKWKQSYRGPVRQAWAIRWLNRLGPRPLAVMGYDLDRLLLDVRAAGSARVDQVGIDTVLLGGSVARRLMRKQALRIQDIPRQLGPHFNPRPRVSVELGRRISRFLISRDKRGEQAVTD